MNNIFCRISALLFFFICGKFLLLAEDVYISPLQLTAQNGETNSSRKATQEELALAALLQKGLAVSSTRKIGFKPLPSLSPASQKILNRDLVLTKLEASVVCYYENIDYLLYGKIAVDESAFSFKASVSLYERNTNAVLKQLEFRDSAESAEAYLRKMIPLLAKDIQILFPEKDQTVTTVPPRIDETPPDKTEVPRKDKTGIRIESGDESGTSVKDEKTTEQNEAADEKGKTVPPRKKEHAVSLHVEGGLFAIFQHEWLVAIEPVATADLGIKLELPLLDSAELDFSLRLAGALCYSFAHNLPAIPYISYHSLKIKSAAEFYLQFSEFFAVYLGGGPFYQVDVIDFQNVSASFFTDRAYTLGIQALLGIEFLLNAEGTFGLGLVNTLEVALFSTTSIEYSVRIVFIFRI